MSNEEYTELVKSGKLEYLTPLWEQTEKVLYMYVNKYYNRLKERFDHCGVTFEDLEQECYFIFLKMIEAYDTQKGYKFLTYAEYQFKAHLRELLKIGGNYAKEPLNSCDYLDRTISEESDTTLGEVTKDKFSESVFSDVDEVVYQQQLHNALDIAMSERLNEQQAAVITDRFYNNCTLKECGENNGVTLSQARHIESDSLRRLRIAHSLDGFKDDILTAKAYQATGVSSFRNNQASSVERTFEWLSRYYG